jgi:hypothetical protein
MVFQPSTILQDHFFTVNRFLTAGTWVKTSIEHSEKCPIDGFPVGNWALSVKCPMDRGLCAILWMVLPAKHLLDTF